MCAIRLASICVMSYHDPSLTRETSVGDCRYCGRSAGWFRTSHPRCRDAHRSGLARMVDLAAQAAERPEFTQRRVLQLLARLAQECYVRDEDLPAVLAAGWHISSMNRTVDRVPTRAETDWLRELREGQIAAAATQAHEEPALLSAAVAAALATRNQPPRLEQLSRLLEQSGLTDVAGHMLLLRAWERAVLRLLGATGIDLDREAALLRYARHFDLDDDQLDRHGMLRQFIQGAAIAASAAGLIPHRMTFPNAVVASLGLDGSEQPIWLFDDAEYRVGPLPADQAATIAGVSLAGRTPPYYPPQLFTGREAPGDGWETVATSRMALTGHGLRLRSSTVDVTLSYGSVHRWEPYRDGIGAVVSQPDQPERLAVFRNGDGWFTYNLVRNLAASAP